MRDLPSEPTLQILRAGKPKTLVVIGAGVVGCCAALWLRKAGHRVTLVDRNEPGTGASFGNAGCIANYECAPIASPGIIWKVPRMLLDPLGPLAIKWRYLPHLSGWLIRFLLASRRSRYEEISSTLARLLPLVLPSYKLLLGNASGDLLHYGGAIIIYRGEKGFASARGAVSFHRKFGIDCELLSRDDIRQLEPSLAHIYSAGILYPGNVHIKSPQAFVDHLFREFVQLGGRFVKVEVRSIRKTAIGLNVLTNGNPIEADRAILAAGAWSRSIVQSIGDDLPLDTERGYHVTFEGAQDLITRPVCLMPTGFYITPMANALRAAGTVELGGLRAAPTTARYDLLASETRKLLPSLGEPSTRWMGFRPSMPDSMPVIGPSQSVPELYYAFGHGHLGLSFAALTGYLLLMMIDDRIPPIDPLPYSAARFGMV